MLPENNLIIRKRYRLYGLWICLFLGIIAGIIIGGSRFREWENPVSSWLILIASCSVIGAIMGFVFFGSLGPNDSKSPNDFDGYGGSSGGDYGGYDAGGDSGGDGGGH